MVVSGGAEADVQPGLQEDADLAERQYDPVPSADPKFEQRPALQIHRQIPGLKGKWLWLEAAIDDLPRFFEVHLIQS
jgi:hypothetical protein